MFESRISAGVTEKLPESEKSGANVIAWSSDMEGHAKKLVGTMLRIGKPKTIEKLYKVSTLCLDDHRFK